MRPAKAMMDNDGSDALQLAKEVLERDIPRERYIAAELEVRGADDDRPLPTWAELDAQEEELSDMLEQLKALNEENYNKADEALRLAKAATKQMDKMEQRTAELDKLYTDEVEPKLAEEKVAREAKAAEVPAADVDGADAAG